MAIHVYGKKTVAAAGTLVPLDTDGLGRYLGQITIQALAANTGKLYFGTASMVKATGVGVIAAIAPGAILTLPAYQTGVRAEQFYFDVDTNGEAGYVSAEVL